jgi:excisionase family DNA binding protein
MAKELFTVEEASIILNLHIKTVRRFLREGRIRGRKIGRSWMISAEDLKEYAHGELKREDSPPEPRERVSMNVSAVVEFFERVPGEASRYSNSLIAMLNVKDPSWGESRFDFMYHPDEGKARFVLFGTPRFIGEIMKFMEIIQEQE